LNYEKKIINQCISAYTDLEKARVNVDKERSILRHNGSDLIDDDSQTSTVIADAIERLKQKQSDAQKSIDDTTTSIEYLQARKESLSGYEKKILMFKNSHHEIATAKSRSDEIGKAVHDLERRLEEQEIAQNSKRDRGSFSSPAWALISSTQPDAKFLVLELEASFNKKKNDFEPRMKKSEEEAKNLRGTFEQFGAANKNIACV
jgi:cell division septum initiation protein DivIVA